MQLTASNTQWRRLVKLKHFFIIFTLRMRTHCTFKTPLGLLAKR
jgi:hypothetical protein